MGQNLGVLKLFYLLKFRIFKCFLSIPVFRSRSQDIMCGARAEKNGAGAEENGLAPQHRNFVNWFGRFQSSTLSNPKVLPSFTPFLSTRLYSLIFKGCSCLYISSECFLAQGCLIRKVLTCFHLFPSYGASYFDFLGFPTPSLIFFALSLTLGMDGYRFKICEIT